MEVNQQKSKAELFAYTGEIRFKLLRNNSVYVLTSIFPKSFLLHQLQTIKSKKLFKNTQRVKRIFNCPNSLFLNLKLSDDHIFVVDFSPDNDFIAAGGINSEVYIYGINPLNKLSFARMVYRFQDHTDTINTLQFSPNGLLLATGSEDSSCVIYNLKYPYKKKGKLVELFDHQSYLEALSFSADSRHLVTAGFDFMILIYNTAIESDFFGRKLIKLSYHTDAVNNVCFSPCGKFLASSSDDMSIVLLNLESIKSKVETHKKINEFFVSCFAYSYCGDFLLIGCETMNVILLGSNPAKPETFLQILHTFENHSEQVTSVAFSSFNKFFASSGTKGDVIIYEVDKKSVTLAPKQQYKVFIEDIHLISCITFSPNFTYFATIGEDFRISIYC